MFSLTQKIRAYRTEQRRHAQIAREIDDALTNHQLFSKAPWVQDAVEGMLTQEARNHAVNSMSGYKKMVATTKIQPLKLGENAGY